MTIKGALVTKNGFGAVSDRTCALIHLYRKMVYTYTLEKIVLGNAYISVNKMFFDYYVYVEIDLYSTFSVLVLRTVQLKKV